MTDRIRDLLEELLVDAYGDGEQLGALEVGFHDNIEFPFAATVLDHPVEVESVEFDGNERRGLVALTDRGVVSLLDVTPKPPEAIEYLNVYRAWANVELLEAKRPR